jgi:hypothetical protein
LSGATVAPNAFANYVGQDIGSALGAKEFPRHRRILGHCRIEAQVAPSCRARKL